MRFLDWLSVGAARLAEELADASRAALYVRQLLRGNRSASMLSPGGRGPAPEADSPTRAAVPTGPDTPGPTTRPPVLLVHGYFATRGSLHLLERRLGERGAVVLSYRLGPLHLAGIRSSAARIGRKIEALCAQTSVDRIDLVGHSMGGLVGLYYLKHLGGRHRLRKLVLLGAPARGTWTALLGLPAAALGPGSLDLLPRSSTLDELHRGPLPPEVEVTAIAGSRDFFAPPSSTVLSGARQVTLPTTHAGLLVDPRVADEIFGILTGTSNASHQDGEIPPWAQPATL
jgi:pimeloyl-ACP methyl ester carboxylesterase